MKKLNIPAIDHLESNELMQLEDAFLTLAVITIHMRSARVSRLIGKIKNAKDHERFIDLLYKRLPEWARW